MLLNDCPKIWLECKKMLVDGPVICFVVQVRDHLKATVLTILANHMSRKGTWWDHLPQSTQKFIEDYIKDRSFIDLWHIAGGKEND